MTYRVLIADDEPLARRRLGRFLRAEPDVEVVAECASGGEAAEALSAAGGEIDLALLDIQMPELDGFGVIDQVGAERMPPVIFVTAYDAFALKAFEVHALDYLLKPLGARRFRTAFRRARAQHERARSAEAAERLRALLAHVAAEGALGGEGEGARAAGTPAPGAAPAVAAAPRARYADRVTVKHDGRVFFVSLADVDWFESDGNRVRVHVGRATHVGRETLAAIEAAVDPDRFARIHRGTIVNLDRIRELQPWFGGDYVVLLRDGTKLKLSRTYWEGLQARLRVIS